MASVLVIGGGLAGLFTALKLSPLPCTIISPLPLGQGASSAWAQGGIAAAIGAGDSVDKHVADTLAAGAGLCDERMVRLMASEANDRIHDLLAYGVPFDRDLQGRLVQSREAAHSAHRIVRVRGDMAGAAIMEALVAAVRKTPSIRVIEGVEALELEKWPEDTVIGCSVEFIHENFDRAGGFMRADRVVLATGGIGHLFARSTNPPEARGLGLAMASLAGARIANAEFVQFHPTALDIGLDPAPLATEALRGEGAILINKTGERFALAHHPDGELAPRDIVARAVFEEWVAGRRPMLDARAAIGERFPEAFPAVYARCRAAGIDPVTQPIPVVPAEHYHMGGVATDENGQTSLKGLYAVGEVACTGVHGANRLASNSLLEAVVFAARAAEHIRADLGGAGSPVQILDRTIANPQPEPLDEIARVRSLMAERLGVVRTGPDMQAALDELMALRLATRSRAVFRMTTAAMLIAASALERRESRGAHFRTDFPATDPVARPSEAPFPGLLAERYLERKGALA
ncbi:MAG: L-aspartate oxidase [Beijerinckiaceae bacterium]|jgi:L-aspartate oxidase|nr:L-aspartate oxidase [Beijerinckiaceae bacterium]